MGKKAFDMIADGLKDAIEHASGNAPDRKVHRMEVPDVGQMRNKLHLSQSEFADTFGVPLGTVKNWEQGRRRPVGASLLLLQVIKLDPTPVLLALRESRPKQPVRKMARTAAAGKTASRKAARAR
jgi:putative transcriptional regulator